MASKLQTARRIGLYEKALPPDWDFARRIDIAQKLGFHYLELSVDESEARLARLNWGRRERQELRNLSWNRDFPLHSLCLSGHRRYPFGSQDPATRQRAHEIMEQGIELAYDLGIRIIQLAGYDVYYEEHSAQTHQRFIEGLQRSCDMAAKAGIILALEIMDSEYLNSILKYLDLSQQISSPFLAVYPDLGNLAAWGNDLELNLERGIDHIAALHIKDTLRVQPGFPGQFRDLVIGEGDVDFVHYFQILHRLRYAGPFVIEMWAQHDMDAAACSSQLQLALQRVHDAMDQAQFALQHQL